MNKKWRLGKIFKKKNATQIMIFLPQITCWAETNKVVDMKVVLVRALAYEARELSSNLASFPFLRRL